MAENQVDQKMLGVHLVETRQGAKDWELFATQAESLKRFNKWSLKEVRILFYSADQLQFTVTGKTGEIDTVSRDLKIEGDVVTQTPDGYEFRSALILYSAQSRILRSPTPVKVNGTRGASAMQVRARFMHAEVDSENIHLDQDVEAWDTASASSPVRVLSRRAVMSRSQRIARFFDGTQIFFESYKSRSPEAIFKFNEAETRVIGVDLFSGVNLEMPEKTAKAERVFINLETEQIFLEGQPVVTSGEDQISGDQMIITEEGDRIEVKNMRATLDRSEAP
jgi:LPS export ABC transporter protein LptC